MLSESNKKIVKFILLFLLVIIGIVIIIKFATMGIITLVGKGYSSQFVSVGRDIAIKKGEKLYSLVVDAQYLINEEIVSFGDKNYVYGDKNEIIKIEDYEKYGIFSQMSAMYDGEIYSVIQIGTGYKAGGPNPEKVYCDVLMNISPALGEENILYKTDVASRIVGFDIEKNLVILFNEKGQVCSLNLETKEEKVLMQINKGTTPLLFQWSNDRLFVFEGRTNSEFIGSCGVE